MSGFGIRAFKKVKEDSIKKEESIYKQHIVYGDNSYAAYTAIKLAQKYGNDNVILISTNLITADQIKNEWACSINTIRDEQSASILQGEFARLEVLKCDRPVKFYKDTKFHKFGGRAKPFTLQEDEEFFSSTYYNVHMENLFTNEEWESLNDSLEKLTAVKIIKDIEKVKSTDLVEKTNFSLKSGEFEKFNCETLHFCHSPKELFNLITNKNDLSLELTGFCSALEQRVALTVNFETNKKIRDFDGTIFLPQSATHEWGHYILDFDLFDPSINKQSFNAMMFINLDEVNEEELAKKIKHMKRVIERVYPEFSKSEYGERIHYAPDFLIKSFPENESLNCEGLNFIGVGANLSELEFKPILLTRALLSLKDL